MEIIANKIIHFVIEVNDKELDYEVCRFGILMAMEVVINTLIALFISLKLGMFIYGLAFLLIFSFLRAFAGGIHLKKFWCCTLLSSIMFSLALLVVKYIRISLYILAIIGVILSIIMILIGPVDNINRRISEAERKLCYKRLIGTIIILLAISVICILFGYYRMYMLIFTTISISVLTQTCGKIENIIINQGKNRYS